MYFTTAASANISLCVFTYYSDCFHFAGADRKDLVGILQQYQAFTRHVQSGLGALRIVQWDMSIRLLCFPESESKESLQDVAYLFVYHFDCDITCS